MDQLERVVKTGDGWRLGWSPGASEFTALVGGDDWAVELTAAEFADFCRLVQQLAASMAEIAPELMDEEAIACELETERLWMEVDGFPEAYRLSFILSQGRRAEGAWPAAVVPDLLQGLATLQVF